MVYIASSVIINPSLVLETLGKGLGLNQVLRKNMERDLADKILSLAWFLIDQISLLYSAEKLDTPHVSPFI